MSREWPWRAVNAGLCDSACRQVKWVRYALLGTALGGTYPVEGKRPLLTIVRGVLAARYRACTGSCTCAGARYLRNGTLTMCKVAAARNVIQPPSRSRDASASTRGAAAATPVTCLSLGCAYPVVCGCCVATPPRPHSQWNATIKCASRCVPLNFWNLQLRYHSTDTADRGHSSLATKSPRPLAP